jgi:hypothetical protein
MTTLMDDRYEQLAAQFQYQQIDMLRQTLAKHGVDHALAQEICGDFTFDLSVFFDQGEIPLDGESYRPSVAFTADEETFYVQPDDVEYHVYAFGSTREVFDNPPTPPEASTA